MSEHAGFSLTLNRKQDFVFEVAFDQEHFDHIYLDEPEPLGSNSAPNASRILGAAVGNCLSASLLFCLQKSRVAVKSLRTEVQGTLARNERNRLRIGRLDVTITLEMDAEEPKRAERCLSLFQDYCVVSASVKKGIPVSVRVVDSSGHELFYDDGSKPEG